MNIQFGTGLLYVVPNAGNTATDPTPYKLGILQEISIDFKADLKKLFGQYQFPVAKARGKIEVNCKAKMAVLDPNFMNQLYFGQSQAAGMNLIVPDEPHNIPASSPYTVTVTNSTGFLTDYGVVYTATGQQLIKLPSGTPAAGQYTEAAGVYTFAAADAGLAVNITYTYTLASVGTTITLVNQLMGYAPEFRAYVFNTFRTKRFGIELNSCTMGSLSIPTKQEDFWVSDIEFDAGVDASSTLGSIYADLS